MKNIPLFFLCILLFAIPSQAQRISSFPEKTTIPDTYLFLLEDPLVANYKATMATVASNVASRITVIAVATNSTIGVATNGIQVSGVATQVNLVAGTNVVLLATNVSGKVSIGINAASGGGGIGTSTNAVNRGENLSLTNSTRIGIFSQIANLTNMQFRTISAGYGIILTNLGTNIPIAVDPTVLLTANLALLPFTNYTRLVFVGDSLTVGQNADLRSYPFWLQNYFWANHPYVTLFTNVAHSGQTTPELLLNYPSEVLPHAPTAGTNAIVFFWGGINDLFYGSNAVATIGGISNYWRTAKANGFKVVAFTLSDRNDFSPLVGTEIYRSEVNAWVKGHGNLYDYLVDVDRLYPIVNLLSQPDGIHFSTNAYSGPIAKAVVDSFYDLGPASVTPELVSTNVYSWGDMFAQGQMIALQLSTRTIGNHGAMTVNKGDAANSGYLAWYDPSFIRLAYFGYNVAGGLTLNMEASTNFNIVGGRLGIATTAPTNTLDVVGNASIRTNLYLPNLPTNGSPIAFLAVDGGGKVYETATPAGGGGGSATNAQPPSAILTNVAALGALTISNSNVGFLNSAGAYTANVAAHILPTTSNTYDHGSFTLPIRTNYFGAIQMSPNARKNRTLRSDDNGVGSWFPNPAGGNGNTLAGFAPAAGAVQFAQTNGTDGMMLDSTNTFVYERATGKLTVDTIGVNTLITTNTATFQTLNATTLNVNNLVVTNSGRIFVQTNTVIVTNTTTSTALLDGKGTTNITANLLAVGNTIRIKMWGILFTTNGTPTGQLTFKVKLGGTTAAQSLLSVTAPPAGSNGGVVWTVNCDSVVRSTGAAGQIMTGGTLTMARAAGTTYDVQAMSNLVPASFDTTAALSVSLESVDTVLDGTSVWCQGGTIELIP